MKNVQLSPAVNSKISRLVEAMRATDRQPSWAQVEALAWEIARAVTEVEHDVQRVGDRLMAVQTVEIVEKACSDAVAAERTRVVDAIVRLVSPREDRLLSRLIDAVRLPEGGSNA